MLPARVLSCRFGDDAQDLVLTRELVVHLIDPEEAIGERGYYVASLEAAMQHVLNLRVGKHS